MSKPENGWLDRAFRTATETLNTPCAPAKVTIYQDFTGEWSEFHVNGEKVSQDHYPRYDEILEHLHSLGIIEYERFSASPEDDTDWDDIEWERDFPNE